VAAVKRYTENFNERIGIFKLIESLPDDIENLRAFFKLIANQYFAPHLIAINERAQTIKDLFEHYEDPQKRNKSGLYADVLAHNSVGKADRSRSALDAAAKTNAMLNGFVKRQPDLIDYASLSPDEGQQQSFKPYYSGIINQAGLPYLCELSYITDIANSFKLTDATIIPSITKAAFDAILDNAAKGLGLAEDSHLKAGIELLKKGYVEGVDANLYLRTIRNELKKGEETIKEESVVKTNISKMYGVI
jgi:hypothetical protein